MIVVVHLFELGTSYVAGTLEAASTEEEGVYDVSSRIHPF